MAREQLSSPDGNPLIVRCGADDQLAALERLWAIGVTSNPEDDEKAWQTLRWALNTSRRDAGARLLIEDE